MTMGAGTGHGRTGETGQEPANDALMREMRLQRNLKILVVGLGVMILAGLAGVAVKVIKLGSAPSGTAASVTVPRGAASSEIVLELPKGAQIVSSSVAGNRLAVQYTGPSGTGIAVIDLDTGRRVADVKAREAVPGGGQ
jgi:hypothetical protein